MQFMPYFNVLISLNQILRDNNTFLKNFLVKVLIINLINIINNKYLHLWDYNTFLKKFWDKT